MKPGRVVVVGIDGSESSREALAYALEDAAVRGDSIRAVSVVAPPDLWATAYGLPTMPTREGEFEATQRALDETVAKVVKALGATVDKVPVETLTVAGSPAEGLVGQATQADLLVIGHRGRGRIASAVLGSVSLHCVMNAPCPVTVVRLAHAAR